MSRSVRPSWLRSPRAWIGGAAVFDLLARLPEDLLAPLVSLLGGYSGSRLLAGLSTWLLFAVVFYTFAPLVYRLVDPLPAEETGFRLVFAGGATLTGLALELTTGVTRFAAVFGAIGAVAASFLLYLKFGLGWTLLDPDGPAIGVLQTITAHNDVREEVRTDLEREGWLGAVGAGLYLAATGGVVAFPAFLGGVISQVFVYAYPVPDLLFLGWAVSAALLPRIDLGPTADQLLDVKFDLEEYLLDAVENATRSIQGLFVTSFVLLGVFQAAGYLFLAVGTAPAQLRTLDAALSASASPAAVGIEIWLLLWNLLGITALLGFAGAFSLWAWLRELQRLPHFLDRWEGRTTASGEPLARPRGFVAPALAALLAVAGYAVVLPSAPGTPWDAPFAVGWPLLIALGVRSARVPDRPQSIAREHVLIGASLYAHVVTMWLLAEVVVAVGSDGASIADAVSTPVVPVVLGIVLLFVGALPTVNRYEERRADGGHRGYAFVGYLLALGVVTALLVPFTSASIGVAVATLSVAAFVAGAAIGLIRYVGL